VSAGDICRAHLAHRVDDLVDNLAPLAARAEKRLHNLPKSQGRTCSKIEKIKTKMKTKELSLKLEKEMDSRD